MSEKYEKKDTYQFCRIKNLMVRIAVIQATVQMPDMAHAEIRLVPADCSRAVTCKQEKIRCIVYDKGGEDPCPDAWHG